MLTQPDLVGEKLTPSPVVWYLLGSLKAAVRRAYEIAREQREEQVIAFVPWVARVPRKGETDKYGDKVYSFPFLAIRGFAFSELEKGPQAASGLGYGNLMVYRVCAVKEPGFLAKQAGVRGIEEDRLLGELVSVGWKKTYKWISFDELDVYRVPD
jgi:hypothetical protein